MNLNLSIWFFYAWKCKKISYFLSYQLQKLTAGPSSPYCLYTHLSCLFQIIFDYERLAEFPIENFLPWHCLKRGFRGNVNYYSIFVLTCCLHSSLFVFLSRHRFNTIRTVSIWYASHRNETYFPYAVVMIYHDWNSSSTNACSNEQGSLYRS